MPDELTDNLSELLAELLVKVPESLRPIAKRFGPWIVRQSVDEAWAWIRLANENWKAAYRQAAEAISDQELLALCDDLIEGVAEENIKHESRRQVSQEIGRLMIGALVSIILAHLGLPRL